ncbi:MAG: transporter [Psychroserpens sp.]|uniref:OmpP1/FadL family transporter n=1 Tax=Psychroserpens sp. TaxID=2020870 RepID=UPI003CA4F9E5
MKKLTMLLIIGVFAMPYGNAQEIADALRFSQDEVQGSARFRALSGAFGALGGDMSAVSINPAGSAVFTRSHASFSLSSLNVDNNTTFFNNSGSSSDSKIDLHQGGAAFVFANRNESSNWKKLVLSIAYDKTANYRNQWFARGTNTNSIDNYFLAYAQGQRLDEISLPNASIEDAYADIGSFFGFGNQQAFLGFGSFILEPVEDTVDNTAYFSNIAEGTFNQEHDYISRGYNGKFAFNASGQYGDNLYLGLNLNAHFINYERFTRFTESNTNVGSLVTDVAFENNLVTTGNGFSFQLGAILKVTNELRAGLTYNSPTWFTIYEETSQFLATSATDDLGTFSTVIDPAIVNIFPEYRLQSPGKITGSLAYVFGEQGLLSFDYSRRNFRNTKFRPTSDAFFASQNEIMNDLFTTANTFRFGGEYKYQQFSFRGGYRLEESPYKDDSVYGNLNGYSLGLGYNFGNTRLDLTYDRSERTVDNQLFAVGLTDAATLDTTRSNITLTLGFSL